MCAIFCPLARRALKAQVIRVISWPIATTLITTTVQQPTTLEKKEKEEEDDKYKEGPRYDQEETMLNLKHSEWNFFNSIHINFKRSNDDDDDHQRSSIIAMPCAYAYTVAVLFRTEVHVALLQSKTKWHDQSSSKRTVNEARFPFLHSMNHDPTIRSLLAQWASHLISFE